jgi:hypothetical protein
MKKVLLFVLSILAVSAYADTSDIKFDYQKSEKTLTVSGDLCTYGKRSKQKLPEAVIDNIHNYVKDYNKDFIEQIKNIKTGMFGRRLNTAELAIMYQLNDKHLNMDYYFEGNNACVTYQAIVTLDFSNDDSTYFDFDQPDTWTFLAKSNDLFQINNAIKSVYPSITITKQDLPQNEQSALIVLSKVSGSFSLYKFDAKKFNQIKLLALNSVFVNAPEPYKSAMEQYLTSYQFNIAEDVKDTNWYLHITPKEISEGISFRVSYQSKTSVNKVVKNDPYILPTLPTSNDDELKDIILLHLEMMEFVQLLESP